MISKLVTLLVSFAVLESAGRVIKLLSTKVVQSDAYYYGWFEGYGAALNHTAFDELDPEVQQLIGFLDGYYEAKLEYYDDEDWDDEEDCDDEEDKDSWEDDCEIYEAEGYDLYVCTEGNFYFYEDGSYYGDYVDGSSSSADADGNWKFEGADGSWGHGDAEKGEYYDAETGIYTYYSSEGDYYTYNSTNGELSWAQSNGDYGYGNDDYFVNVYSDGSYEYGTKGEVQGGGSSDGSAWTTAEPSTESAPASSNEDGSSSSLTGVY
mmetsp:Transcript_3295/g.6825  ORF Transcript_3295/g.6825 Transcript_3295/m.6825 type:complete len:264 (+) Transcript_3295:1-792(+)